MESADDVHAVWCSPGGRAAGLVSGRPRGRLFPQRAQVATITAVVGTNSKIIIPKFMQADVIKS